MILELIDKAIESGARLKTAAACIGLTARTIIRWRRDTAGEDQRRGPRHAPANKLSQAEREKILAVATSPAFRDLSPKQIVPQLADQGRYIASESSFYRVLKEKQMLTHRQAARPATTRPPRALTASGACQVWSWDITFLRTSVQGMFFYLYLFLDVWSRKIVAAEVFAEESMEHSARLFHKACFTHALNPDHLVLHADNGGPMKGSTMLATLQKLGVVPSFSRPRVSDDNPFSEALFRTLKYRPQYPPRAFERLEEAQAWWISSLPGTIPSTFIAPSASLLPMTATTAANRPSWLTATAFTKRRVNAVRTAGRKTLETGTRCDSCSSTRKRTKSPHLMSFNKRQLNPWPK